MLATPAQAKRLAGPWEDSNEAALAEARIAFYARAPLSPRVLDAQPQWEQVAHAQAIACIREWGREPGGETYGPRPRKRRRPRPEPRLLPVEPEPVELTNGYGTTYLVELRRERLRQENARLRQRLAALTGTRPEGW